MFVWAERSNVPEFTNEMIHYRNAMVKEINFVFSDSYAKKRTDSELQEQLEKLKTLREKTADRIQKEEERNKVWFELFYEVVRNSADFNSAELFLKYYNIPNEVIFADFYYLMKTDKSIYQQLIKDQSFNTSFDFLQFFPISDRLLEFTELLKTAVRYENNAAVLFLVENIHNDPYDSLLRDNEIRKLLQNEYKKSERGKRLKEGRTIAEVLKSEDYVKRISALEAMINKNHKDAVSFLKEIRNIEEFKPVIKEYYKYAMRDGNKNKDVEQYRLAYAYARYGRLSEGGDKNYVEEPAGKLFEYYLTQVGASEADYFEAEKYISQCNDRFVQDIVAKQMLVLINNNQSTQAKHLKERFNVDFHPGDYKYESEVLKYFRNLTETYGVHEIPKGEENLQTAFDIAKLFNFSQKDIDEVKALLCKFHMVNKFYDKAKKYFVQSDKELTELAINQIQTFINSRDYKAAYALSGTLPIQYPAVFKSGKKKEIKQFKNLDEVSPENLAMAIVSDDIFELKVFPASFYHQAFEYGISSGQSGVQFLVELNTAFKKYIEACSKIALAKYIKSLLSHDKISAEMLGKAYGEYAQPDFFDYIIYILKKLLGIC